MPNPLILNLNANPEGQKPAALRGGQAESEKSASFHEVMSEDAQGDLAETGLEGLPTDEPELELGTELPDGDLEDPASLSEHDEDIEIPINPHPEANSPGVARHQNDRVEPSADHAGDKAKTRDVQRNSRQTEGQGVRRFNTETNAESSTQASIADQQQKVVAKPPEHPVFPQNIVHQAIFLKAAGPVHELNSGEHGQHAPSPETGSAPEVGRRVAPMAANPRSALPFNVTLAASEPAATESGTLFADDIGGPMAQRETLQAQAARDLAPLPTSTAARTEITRAIAGQMAAVISAKPGSGGVEIALNPEELGRVAITLNGREDGLIVSIAVERPETLDLLRRHITTLTAEFQKAGYDDLTFDLGSSDGGWQDSSPDQDGTTFAQDTPEDTPKPARNRDMMASGRGLDMRL